jgi:hypothetical protein
MSSPPSGGGTSQILTKNSGTDRDWSWLNSALADVYVNTYLSGYWYSHVVVFNSATSGSGALVANSAMYYPLFLPYSVTIKALAYCIAVANTGQTSLGVYSSLNGLPSTLLCSVTGLGQTLGVITKSLTNPSTCVIPGGLNYLGITFTNSPSVQIHGAGIAPLVPGGFVETPSPTVMSPYTCLYSAASGGVLPTAPTSFTQGTGTVNVAPIWFQVN